MNKIDPDDDEDEDEDGNSSSTTNTPAKNPKSMPGHSGTPTPNNLNNSYQPNHRGSYQQRANYYMQQQQQQQQQNQTVMPSIMSRRSQNQQSSGNAAQNFEHNDNMVLDPETGMLVPVPGSNQDSDAVCISGQSRGNNSSHFGTQVCV